MSEFLIAIGWLVCAVITAGTGFAYFQGKYSEIAVMTRREDFIFAAIYGLVFGPLGVVLSAIQSGFWQYGWRLR